ncbi:MAG: biotin--[acetyl-CoA-carboxylase] ligase [Candidatus Marinimicrobia bacterium]|nr:biotin--[acetyl-CoA-carboxylase] ligase [Candidatus Neomarinimicrobiota bacterium]
MLFTQLIQANLTTRQLGREITYYPYTGSTNDDLWELLSDGEAQTGHMVLTDHQREGKGRQGRSWYGSAGLGLPFSVLLEPDWPPERLGLISLAAGVAVGEALLDFDVESTLKWPNDVLCKGQKIAGILAEHRSGKIVLGIGINVNEQQADFPDDLQASATSVQLVTGESIQRERLLADIINGLESMLGPFSKDIGARWMALCVHVDQAVTFRSGDATVEGIFEGLDDTGHALINSGNGAVAFSAGDLTLGDG